MIVILVGIYYLCVLIDGIILEVVLISIVVFFFGGLVVIIYMYIVGCRKDFFEFKDFLIFSCYFERENWFVFVFIIWEILLFIFVGFVIIIV